MTSSRFFINSAQPTSLHYHHHRLACTLLWLPQSISTIQSFASFATIPGTLVAPEYILKLSMDPNGLAFLHNGTFLLTEFQLNSAQPTSLRYHHHRLYLALVAPKHKYRSIFCFFCYHPWYSGCTRVHFETLNGSQRPYFFTQRDYFLLTEFQPTCCHPRSSRFWAISIFRKQCSSRPISTPSVVDATIRLSGLRSFNPKI